MHLLVNGNLKHKGLTKFIDFVEFLNFVRHSKQCSWGHNMSSLETQVVLFFVLAHFDIILKDWLTNIFKIHTDSKRL